MESYEITVMSAGNTFLCGHEQSVLDAMVKAGFGPFHYGCYGGGCGVCKIRVRSGSYHVFKNMSKAHITGGLDKDIVLSCCIQPRGPLVIEAVSPGHRALYPSFRLQSEPHSQ